MSATSKAAKEVTNILQGYVSSHPENYAALGDPITWIKSAQDVLRLRQFAILQAFSDDALREIAAGRIDMGKLYVQAIKKNRRSIGT